MNIILLAACVLLIFCHGPRHHHRVQPQAQSRAQSQPQTNIGPVQRNATGKGCERITRGFDSWGNQDDWVSEFPVAQQHRVLECLGKLAKKQGLE